MWRWNIRPRYMRWRLRWTLARLAFGRLLVLLVVPEEWRQVLGLVRHHLVGRTILQYSAARCSTGCLHQSGVLSRLDSPRDKRLLSGRLNNHWNKIRKNHTWILIKHKLHLPTCNRSRMPIYLKTKPICSFLYSIKQRKKWPLMKST